MREEIKKKLDNNLVFLYENAFRDLCFPIQPMVVVKQLAKCRCVSYEKLAADSGKTVQEICRAFNSTDGCTHYDPRRDRYLMAINFSGRSKARIRWTTAHELGHIAAEHFIEIANSDRWDATPSELAYMEEEADYFAASFLAPIPAIRELNARSAADIREWFDLSQIAAEYRWSEYQRTKDEPNALDGFFSWHKARSATKRPKIVYRKPVDVWADERF